METAWFVVVTVMLSNGNVAENGQQHYVFHTQQTIDAKATTLKDCEQFSKGLHMLARMEIDVHYSLETKCKPVKVDGEIAPREFSA